MNEGLLSLLSQYNELNLHDVIDHDRFNEYSIVHHSTRIEGSTLTEVETRLLLEEGITPKGKPLLHSLMVKDHFDALKFILSAANAPSPLSVEFLQKINSLVMKHTGSVYNTVFGEIDASKGMFRKGNVSAGSSYFPNWDKVEPYSKSLVDKLNRGIRDAGDSTIERLSLSFIAHFDLVSIHPWYDGNGRTSRLLMNYIQAIFKLPLAVVFVEDKADYYVALQETRKHGDNNIFLAFMFDQYVKHLSQEIDSFNRSMSQKPKDSGNAGYSFFF